MLGVLDENGAVVQGDAEEDIFVDVNEETGIRTVNVVDRFPVSIRTSTFNPPSVRSIVIRHGGISISETGSIIVEGNGNIPFAACPSDVADSFEVDSIILLNESGDETMGEEVLIRTLRPIAFVENSAGEEISGTAGAIYEFSRTFPTDENDGGNEGLSSSLRNRPFIPDGSFPDDNTEVDNSLSVVTDSDLIQESGSLCDSQNEDNISSLEVAIRRSGQQSCELCSTSEESILEISEDLNSN